MYLLYVCHTCIHCFVWDKDAISDSAAEQPHCGSPSKPTLQVRIKVDQQIKLHCFYSFSISKPPLSSRNFVPLHWLGKTFLLRNKAARSLPFPAFPDRPAKWTSPHPTTTQWSSFLCKMGARAPLGKEGALKDPTKQKLPPKKLRTRSPSSLAAGSTAKAGALARDLRAGRRGGGLGISRGRLSRYQGLHGNNTAQEQVGGGQKGPSVPATSWTRGTSPVPMQHVAIW